MSRKNQQRKNLEKTRRRPRVAYFCMEFGLHEDLKIYGGGLGILAGDILKAARDERYPLVGVGMLWRNGYVTQKFGPDGKLYDCFTDYSYDFLEDTNVSVYVRIRGRQVKIRVWKCSCFGNSPLYLLDTNLPENRDRLITGQLYGGFDEERIAQEMVLGIGGVRALRALKVPIDLYHLNDNHPVFAGLELLREKMDNDRLSFNDAWQKTREQFVFTTHTPVPAGNERHDHELLRYMGAYNGLTHGQMLKLGGDPFGMTVAGLRLSRRANAVAKLHGETARKMWAGISDAAPIITITNGVHNGTWQDKGVAREYARNGDLWGSHQKAKQALLAEVAARNNVKLGEDVLTIGFGRRATGYKRPDLIFRDKKIIERLFKERKLQLIFSGKAHPHDTQGKEAVKKIHAMEERYPGQVVFLQDYDMQIGRMLTRGCDVWLNNPVRPMEASGSSGMKAAMNGVLNLSILDGWWPEGCKDGVTGWAIGRAYEGTDADKVDAAALYDVLLKKVVPTFYNDRRKWISMMRASIKMSQEPFSAARMLGQYYRLLYS